MRTVSLKLHPGMMGAALLAFSALSWAQNQPAQNQPAASPAASEDSCQNSVDFGNSLAGAARTTKTQKAGHAKKVFTDEDMEASAGPLPQLKMDGPENADEVVTAISTYKLTHTPEQTEQVVHMWYDQYDQMLATAFKQNHDVAALRNANMSNGNALCQESQDYQKCTSRQMAEQRGMQSDQQEYLKNNNLTMRIQRAFQKVRTSLQMNGLRCTWFRIRTANNIDMY